MIAAKPLRAGEGGGAHLEHGDGLAATRHLHLLLLDLLPCQLLGLLQAARRAHTERLRAEHDDEVEDGGEDDEHDDVGDEVALAVVVAALEAPALEHDAGKVHQDGAEEEHSLHGVVVPEELADLLTALYIIGNNTFPSMRLGGVRANGSRHGRW